MASTEPAENTFGVTCDQTEITANFSGNLKKNNYKALFAQARDDERMT